MESNKLNEVERVNYLPKIEILEHIMQTETWRKKIEMPQLLQPFSDVVNLSATDLIS